MDGFEKIFHTLTGNRPLRWQTRLHGLFMQGESHIPEALDLPTGLGKTSVMAVWLAAKIMGAKLPNRLVYVVDRRTVVDQATGEADKLKTRAETAGLLPDLPISTLRGQNLDNRRWMEDPAAPAIVIGTVDMIGSRLLFQGYGVSTGMRPFQAGLLGADTLLVLDEAHLCPPFQKLLKQIETVDGWKPKERDGVRVPPFRLLSLSATGEQDANAFTLQSEDYNDDFVKQRVGASKRLTILEADVGSKLEGQLADAALALAEEHGGRIAVFCTSREVAQKVVERLSDKKAKRPEGSVVLLAGARRVKERESARTELMRAGFLSANEKEADLPILSDPTFLVATAAGEVGVDLDADHAVMDLVAAERMIQRLGRVNRKGGEDRLAQVQVIDFARPKETEDEAARRKAVRTLIESLSPRSDSGFEASPGALRKLREDHPERLKAARTPDPLYPALDRPTLDAWAMTSLKTHPGRPEVAPWLRGWVEEDEPEVTLVWRKWPWDEQFGLPDAAGLADFFEKAPPRMAEKLEVPRSLAMEILAARAKALAGRKTEPQTKEDAAKPVDNSTVLIALDDTVRTLSLGKLKEKGDREIFFNRSGAGTVIVVCHALGGLDSQGLLSAEAAGPANCLDEGWDEATLKRVGLRVLGPDVEPKDDWRAEDRYALRDWENPDSEQVLTIAVYRGRDQEGPGDPAIRRREQALSEHQDEAAVEVGLLADRLNLPSPYRAMLVAAAAVHDLGKARPQWQRAMGAQRVGGPYAKTTGKGANLALLTINGETYRHEFGSLLDLERRPDHLSAVPADLRDLALHLVAAHHGYARPWIAPVDPDQRTSLESHRQRAASVALRFARLQAQWGPWGLAWWEALLRAADQRVSRRLDRKTPDKPVPDKPGPDKQRPDKQGDE